MTRDLLVTFLRKEVRDLRGNRQVWPGYLILPLVAIVLPGVFLAIVPFDDPGRLDPDLATLLRLADRDPALLVYPAHERMARLIVREMTAIFLLIPVILSGMSAGLSIAAEKQQRTLEPILATPVSDRALLVAKLLAAIGPAVVVTWVTAAISALVVAVTTWVRLDAAFVPGAPWLLAVFVLAPLCGAGSALIGIRASMRSSDVQSAVQTAGLWVVPLGMVFVGIVGRPALRSTLAATAGTLLVLAINWLLLRSAERRFEREEILSRWT